MTQRSKFEQLALIHMDAAHNLAFYLLRDRTDAEDAVQDAYLRAYRAFHQLAGEEVKPWLLTIVRNVCYRHLQGRRRSGNVVSLDEALMPKPGQIAADSAISARERSPEQAAIAASEQSVLSEAIGMLPAVFREVIVLREIEDLSYREIADVIGAPVGTVMSRLSRAREELRNLMVNLLNRNDSNAL